MGRDGAPRRFAQTGRAGCGVPKTTGARCRRTCGGISPTLIWEQVETDLRYEGYIRRQEEGVARGARPGGKTDSRRDRLREHPGPAHRGATKADPDHPGESRSGQPHQRSDAGGHCVAVGVGGTRGTKRPLSAHAGLIRVRSRQVAGDFAGPQVSLCSKAAISIMEHTGSP